MFASCSDRYRLLTLSNSLAGLEVDVRRTFAALTALLGSDEDMATMCASMPSCLHAYYMPATCLLHAYAYAYILGGDVCSLSRDMQRCVYAHHVHVHVRVRVRVHVHVHVHVHVRVRVRVHVRVHVHVLVLLGPPRVGVGVRVMAKVRVRVKVRVVIRYYLAC